MVTDATAPDAFIGVGVSEVRGDIIPIGNVGSQLDIHESTARGGVFDRDNTIPGIGNIAARTAAPLEKSARLPPSMPDGVWRNRQGRRPGRQEPQVSRTPVQVVVAVAGRCLDACWTPDRQRCGCSAHGDAPRSSYPIHGADCRAGDSAGRGLR